MEPSESMSLILKEICKEYPDIAHGIMKKVNNKTNWKMCPYCAIKL